MSFLLFLGVHSVFLPQYTEWTSGHSENYFCDCGIHRCLQTQEKQPGKQKNPKAANTLSHIPEG